MIDMLSRYIDRDLSLGSVDPSAVRQFFADWADHLRGACTVTTTYHDRQMWRLTSLLRRRRSSR
jgi:hypothetical protein